MLRSICLAVAACLLSASAPPVLRSTSAPAEDAPPPTATLDQIDWLIGQWSGTGIGGAPAHESWLPPVGRTMVGTFVQETSAGGIQFTEHMYVMEEEGSLVLKLKHFNADLTGWEEKDDMLTFRLKAIAPCFAQFGGITFSCIAMGDPGKGLFITVTMKEGGELAFRLLRSDMASVEQCMDVYDIPKQEACLADRLESTDALRARYLEAAITHHTSLAQTLTERGYLAEPDPDGKPDLSIVESIRASEVAFRAYRDAACGAVAVGMEKTVSPSSKMLACSIKLNEQRAWTIWKSWLAGTGSTPAVLPEPNFGT